MCICFWPEFDCPEVTLRGWQDINIQLLLLLLLPPPSLSLCACVREHARACVCVERMGGVVEVLYHAVDYDNVPWLWLCSGCLVCGSHAATAPPPLSVTNAPAGEHFITYISTTSHSLISNDLHSLKLLNSFKLPIFLRLPIFPQYSPWYNHRGWLVVKKQFPFHPLNLPISLRLPVILKLLKLPQATDLPQTTSFPLTAKSLKLPVFSNYQFPQTTKRGSKYKKVQTNAYLF